MKKMNVFKEVYKVEKDFWENPSEITMILTQELRDEYEKLTDNDKKLIKQKLKEDKKFRLNCAKNFVYQYFDVVADEFLNKYQSKNDKKIYSIINFAKVLSETNYWHYKLEDIAQNVLDIEDYWLEKNLEMFAIQSAAASKVQEKNAEQIKQEAIVKEIDDITIEKFYRELCEIVLKDVSNPKYFGIIEYWSQVSSGRLNNPTRRKQFVKAFKAVMPEKFNEFAEKTKQEMENGTANG
jgi:hypothetical protein